MGRLCKQINLGLWEEKNIAIKRRSLCEIDFWDLRETSEDVTIVLVWDLSIMFRERHGVQFEQLNMVREIYRPRVQGDILDWWSLDMDIMRMWSLLVLNYRTKKYNKSPL
jgi:hypothetical protein